MIHKEQPGAGLPKGMIDVLPILEDPLPEGKWFYAEIGLYCIEVRKEEVHLYAQSQMRSLLIYPLYFAWLFAECLGIGLILRKSGFNCPTSSFRQWIASYPWLWASRIRFSRRSFLSTIKSDRYQSAVRAAQKRIARIRRSIVRQEINRWSW